MTSGMVLHIQVVCDDAIPQGFMLDRKVLLKLKPYLRFGTSATPAEAEDWITHNGEVGGDAFADTCTWVAFREIFYNRYFPSSEQQRYEREYRSICQLDRENSGEYMEMSLDWRMIKRMVRKFAAAARNIELLHESGNSNKRDRDGNRMQNRRPGQQSEVLLVEWEYRQVKVTTTSSAHESITRDFNQGHASSSASLSSALGMFYCGSTQHKVKDCPKRSRSRICQQILLDYLLLQTRLYYDSDQAAKTSGSGYHQKDRKPSQNDKTEHGMEKTVQNQGQSPKMPKSESILKNQQSNRSRN
ncbi:hypothetical protein Tco_0345566 [Tanacetum coccineum]